MQLWLPSTPRDHPPKGGPTHHKHSIRVHCCLCCCSAARLRRAVGQRLSAAGAAPIVRLHLALGYCWGACLRHCSRARRLRRRQFRQGSQLCAVLLRRFGLGLAPLLLAFFAARPGRLRGCCGSCSPLLLLGSPRSFCRSSCRRLLRRPRRLLHYRLPGRLLLLLLFLPLGGLFGRLFGLPGFGRLLLRQQLGGNLVGGGLAGRRSEGIELRRSSLLPSTPASPAHPPPVLCLPTAAAKGLCSKPSRAARESASPAPPPARAALHAAPPRPCAPPSAACPGGTGGEAADSLPRARTAAWLSMWPRHRCRRRRRRRRRWPYPPQTPLALPGRWRAAWSRKPGPAPAGTQYTTMHAFCTVAVAAPLVDGGLPAQLQPAAEPQQGSAVHRCCSAARASLCTLYTQGRRDGPASLTGSFMSICMSSFMAPREAWQSPCASST